MRNGAFHSNVFPETYEFLQKLAVAVQEHSLASSSEVRGMNAKDQVVSMSQTPGDSWLISVDASNGGAASCST